MIRLTYKNKGIGEWLAVAAAAASLVILIVYAVYTSGLASLNPLVVVSMIVTIGINMIYFAGEVSLSFDLIGLLEVAATALTAYSLVTFLKASINNLADLLNGIQIFSGGTGNITVIFTILIALLIIGIIEIAACFLGKKEAEKGISIES